MKLLAALMAASGLCWIVGFVVVGSHSMNEIQWVLPLVGLVYVAVGTIVVLRIRATTELPARVGLLWLIAVASALVLSLPQRGEIWSLVLFALTWGSVVFLAWSIPPLLVWSFLKPSDGSRGLREP